jgi:4-amino-4-deoxychorismate lyase
MVPTLFVGIFPAVIYPDYYFSAGVVARLCDQRLSCNPSLAGLKHLNRLEQVLARAEWQDESIAEGVLLNSNGDLIEAVFSNIFIVKNDVLYTPDLSESGVAGVMRRYLIEVVAKALQLNVQVKTLSFSDLLDADECFFCNSLYGVWPIQKLLHTQETDFYRGEITTRLQQYLSQQLNFSLGI